MRHFYLLFSIIFLLLLTGCGSPKEQETPPAQGSLTENEEENMVSIYFFHETACGSCNGTEEFQNLVHDQLYAYYDMYPYRLSMYNVFKSEGKASAEKILEEAGLQINEISWPAALIHGDLYEGMDEISDKLIAAYLKEAESSALYFYRSDCQECIDLKPYMESLPETVSIGGQEIPFRLVSLNSREGDNGDRIRALFEEYGVPDEDQMVPFIFLNHTWLAGQEEIESRLLPLLEQGYGLGMD